MHRSGTSALAGLLHNSNIIMGQENTFIPKPLPENIKGFYENHLFRQINDHILEKCGYAIKSWNTNVPPISANLITKYRMRRILRQYNKKYDKWGWKDPRTCLTLSLWLRELKHLTFLNNCKPLYITRDPYAVAHSIIKRKDTNYEDALKLWLIYNEYALDSIDTFGINTHYLTYNELCNNPMKTSRAIFEFLGLPLDESIVNQFIDPRLNRSSAIEHKYNISKGLAEKLRDLKEKIIDRTP